jgi:TatD DNase family protein
LLCSLRSVIRFSPDDAARASPCVVAIGEIGLDYDREKFCPRDVQLRYFEKQLDLAKACQLPIIFHNRNTSGDFESVVRRRRSDFSTGIVHSFTGTLEEMRDLCDMGLYIGINGCGLRSDELLDMVHMPYTSTPTLHPTPLNPLRLRGAGHQLKIIFYLLVCVCVCVCGWVGGCV